MIFPIQIGNIVREFLVNLSTGWEYWIQQQGHEAGLPLLVAAHGGTQDWRVFMAQWPFHLTMNKDAVAANKFVLLVPLGFPPTADDQYQPERLWRAWNQFYANDEIDDVEFLYKAIEYVTAYMRAALDAAGLTQYNPIDPNRRFLFGYSNGGMMCYRWASASKFGTGYWAALFVFAGSIGGRRYASANVVVNSPQPPSVIPEGISLFHLHGTKDDPLQPTESEWTVPPGTLGDSTTLQRSKTVYDKLRLPPIAIPDISANAITVYYQPQRKAIVEYLTRNQSAFGTFPTGAASQTQLTQPDIDGGTTGQKRTWRRSGTTNPEVVEYRDPELGHTNYWAAGKVQYQTADTIWTNWFVTHPRTTT